MLHEFVDFNRIMIFMCAMDSKAAGADKSLIFAVGINTDEGWVLAVRMTVIGFDEVPKALGELLEVCLYGHQ